MFGEQDKECRAPHEERDLPRRGEPTEEPLELRAVVPQEAREERDRLRPQHFLVGRGEEELAAARTARKAPINCRFLRQLGNWIVEQP